MPEYSTPTLTPAGTSKLTGMNGSSAGNFLVSDILDIIRNTFGQANGVATLDGSGKLPTAQLPDIADDVLVYASKALLPAQGVEAKIYITTDDNVLYRWDATLGDYVQLSVDLSDYATLDDLAAEESARETADTNLNNAISQIDHRVQNLEQAKGSYVVSNYKDGAITPSGKGNWAVVEGLRGVSRVHNQIMRDWNFADITNWSGFGSVSFSATSNICKVTATASGSQGMNYDALSLVNGHVYLVALDVKAETSGHQFGVGFDVATLSNNIAIPIAEMPTSWTRVSGICTLVSSANDGFHIAIASQSSMSAGDFFSMRNVMIRDLTLYFGGSIPSDADTIAEIQQNYPHLLLPSEYGTRIVDSSYSGVRAWARNLWDEEWEVGTIDNETGQNQSGSSTWRCKNYIPIRPNTTLYFLSPSSSLRYYWYDADKNFMGSETVANNTRVVPPNVYYLKIRDVTAGGSTYLYNVCVNESDSQNGTYTPYHAPDTLSLSFTGKSAGSVYEEYFPESGEVTHPVDSSTVTIYALYERESNPNCNFALVSSSTFTKAWLNTASITIAGCLRAVGYDWDTVDTPNLFMAYDTANRIIAISVSKSTTLAQAQAQFDGRGIRYALNEPDPSTFVTPIIDNTLLTESGGRMATVQTGTVVDGSFDLGFITL